MRRFDEAELIARQTMVARLRERGTSNASADAIARVPRHVLVPHFWTLAPAEPVECDLSEGDVRGLEYLYDDDRAVAVNTTSTSTASAPRLLAAQADALELTTGMSVLEIGTGPGYFAAVLAQLVGPDGRVVSVDIDGEIASRARDRLAALGYTNVDVMTRDGDAGAPERAPFDRIVASVGCVDVAAAWLRQLTPAGFALVPLLHGRVHPMVRVDATGSGRVVMCSGYVGIRGRQSGVELWPLAPGTTAPSGEAPLSAELITQLQADWRQWDLGFWIAIEDQRAGFLASLTDGEGAWATIDAASGTVTWAGVHGPSMRDDLLAHAARWTDAGAPALRDYSHRFVVGGEGRWVISRVDHDQVIELGASAGAAFEL